MAALASPRLDDDELPAALTRLVASWSSSAGVAGTFVLDGAPRPSRHDPDLLRIAQEALTNVARHARADRAHVTLGYAPGEVRLDVRDDGCGFDPEAPATGHGLAGLRGRVRAAGGTLDLEAAPGAGCAVCVAVPT